MTNVSLFSNIDNKCAATALLCLLLFAFLSFSWIIDWSVIILSHSLFLFLFFHATYFPSLSLVSLTIFYFYCLTPHSFIISVSPCIYLSIPLHLLPRFCPSLSPNRTLHSPLHPNWTDLNSPYLTSPGGIERNDCKLPWWRSIDFERLLWLSRNLKKKKYGI